jgi:excisionase family DNA binding protein
VLLSRPERAGRSRADGGAEREGVTGTVSDFGAYKRPGFEKAQSISYIERQPKDSNESTDCRLMNQTTEMEARELQVSCGIESDGRLMTVKAAASIVGCHEDTIRRAYISGQLRFVRLGRRGVRIDPVSLRQWLAAGGQTRAA